MNVLHLPGRYLAGALVLAASPAYAAMGNIASSYGLLAGDVASAQSLSLFNPEVSAVYYNPAALTFDPRGELSAGLSFVDHQIQADSLGGAAPVNRQGDILDIDPSRSTLLGLKTNLSSLTKVDHPIYFGLMLGVEKYGREMLAYNTSTSTGGQYFRYDRQPLFLTAGGATRLFGGLDGGLAFRVTLQSNARVTGQSDLAGNTQYEEVEVSAKPELTPIVGGNLNWGRTFCPDDTSCLLHRVDTALTWRAASNTATKVNANVVIPGTVPPPGLNLAISTIDSYQPEALTVGLQYKGDRLRVGITGELQKWSALEDELRTDTVRDQANLHFKDVFIPRLGAEYKLNDTYRVTAGLAWEESALESDRSLDVNYLDNDRYIIGLGASAEIQDPWILAFPVRFDFGYQLQLLQKRQFMLTSSQYSGGAPYETLETSGEVHVFLGSMTLKF
ncbi:MAG TPA: outer membrane protein transport protein [Moraxellaceae bacterium]|nr:outer membrane protein transport protein [Moraxellaceae bacterium]